MSSAFVASQSSCFSPCSREQIRRSFAPSAKSQGEVEIFKRVSPAASKRYKNNLE
jgi:hypothetical protein